MDGKRKMLLVKIVTAATFAVMIAVNALANAIPINGIGTGQVSENYGNLFAPTSLTFAIWGLIYLLLAGYVFYQFGLFKGSASLPDEGLLLRIGGLFSLSSIYNTIWIFAWHYDEIGVSLVLMVHILACLFLINETLRHASLSPRSKILIRLPFSIYYGWITVATIANVTTYLVHVRWDGFGINDQIWTITVLLAGLLIGSVIIVRNRDLAFGLVLVWAYAGILIKHLDGNGFAGRFPEVYTVVVVCLVLFLIAIGRVALDTYKKYKNKRLSQNL